MCLCRGIALLVKFVPEHFLARREVALWKQVWTDFKEEAPALVSKDKSVLHGRVAPKA